MRFPYCDHYKGPLVRMAMRFAGCYSKMLRPNYSSPANESFPMRQRQLNMIRRQCLLRATGFLALSLASKFRSFTASMKTSAAQYTPNGDYLTSIAPKARPAQRCSHRWQMNENIFAWPKPAG